jgi:Flp pilus assembly protein TadG
MRKLTRPTLLHDQTGSELIEYSLASSVLLLVIFGIMDCSRALYTYHYVAQVARQATRYASVRGATWGGTSCAANAYFCTASASDVTSYVQSITPLGFASSNLSVTTTWPGTNVYGLPCTLIAVNNSPGCVVNVRVAYNFSFVLPFLPRSALSLNSTSKIMIAQ